MKLCRLLFVFLLVSCEQVNSPSSLDYYSTGLWQSNVEASIKNDISKRPDSSDFIKKDFGKMYYYFGVDKFWVVYNPIQNQKVLLKTIKNQGEIKLDEDGFVKIFSYSLLKVSDEHFKVNLVEGLLESFFDHNYDLSFTIEASSRCMYIQGAVNEYFCKV